MRGIGAPKAFTGPWDVRTATMREVTQQLHAGVLRADLSWAKAEPARGYYKLSYLDKISTSIDAARAGGAEVILMVWQTPKWASDRRFWRTGPPGRNPRHEYRAYYPPRLDKMAELRTFAKHIAEIYQGRVLAYECWNEPNLWCFLYPQRTASDGGFGAHRYLRILEAFAAGIKAGDPDTQVVAGATAPAGQNTRISTAPQRFARLLKAGGASAFFDVYSHHPYTVGGTRRTAPEAPPRDPTKTVNLANLGLLLRLFPAKPFYLTEYSYATAPNFVTGINIGQVKQANYLRRAYGVAARHPQVKLLIWFPLRDVRPPLGTSRVWGNYGGLHTSDGARKRSWFVFAGGTTLTLEAPATAVAGSAVVLKGQLACVALGGVRGRPLVVLRRRAGTGWRAMATVTSGDGGFYRIRVRPLAATSYRVVWRGVVGSPAVTVAVP